VIIPGLAISGIFHLVAAHYRETALIAGLILLAACVK